VKECIFFSVFEQKVSLSRYDFRILYILSGNNDIMYLTSDLFLEAGYTDTHRLHLEQFKYKHNNPQNLCKISEAATTLELPMRKRLVFEFCFSTSRTKCW